MTPPDLPRCRHRGEQFLPDRWLCTSNRLVLRSGLVSSETCRSRCPYVDHENDPTGPAEAEGTVTPGIDVAALNSTRPPIGGNFEWVSTARLVADSIALAGLLPLDCSGVAGIPRSGMLPATVIATHLHLPLYELRETGQLTRLGHGSRGRVFGFPSESPGSRAGPMAVVDDTLYNGAAMRQARAHLARLKRRAVFAVVYARPEAAAVVDVFVRLLNSPHLLEWNLTNNGPFVGFAANPVYRGGAALDLDGVVVHDSESGGRTGTPYLVPRTQPCKLIATGRRERHRAETASLLHRVGAKWEQLAMLPDGTPDDAEFIARHKAKHYAASECGFFIESDPVQAELIFRLAGKPTICPRTAQVWTSIASLAGCTDGAVRRAPQAIQ